MKGHALLRTIILAGSSLALAIAMFALYQFSQAPVQPAAPVPITATAQPSSLVMDSTTAGEKPVGQLTLPQGVNLRPGGGGRWELYRDDGQKYFNLTWAEWRPIAGRNDTVEIIRPVIQLSTPRGQNIRIEGDEAALVLKSMSGRDAQPRSGQLTGNVKITVDRLTGPQRMALPPEERDVVDDDRRVDIMLEAIDFDVELSRVDAAGPFTIQSRELTVAGEGLTLRYNELENRIEELIIVQGERIEMRGTGGRFPISASTAIVQEAPAEPVAAPEPAPVAQAELKDDADEIPLLVPEPPETNRPRPTDEYTAVFEGKVEVLQFADDQQVGRLAADVLTILFEFGERERAMTKSAPPADPEEADAAEARTSDDPAAKEVVQERVLLTWSGRLHVESKRTEITDEQAADHEQRVQVTAEGSVEVEDPLRRARCSRLVYEDDTGNVKIYGSAEEPAYIASDDLGELTATEIAMDRSAGAAGAVGPGTLDSKGSARTGGDDVPLRVEFAERLNTKFGEIMVTKTDEETGGLREATRAVLKEAEFIGKVRMFHGDERIACERIVIGFDVDESGEIFPTHADAYGDVVAARGRRQISAGRRLLADMTLIERPKPPFDMARARAIAISRGHDPDSLDWQAIRADYENKQQFDPGLKRLQAWGDAQVRDPEQGLEINAETLDCSFVEGRKIERGMVTPIEGGMAFVGLGDVSIAAPQPIPFDTVSQKLQIEGPGRMTLPANRDLDGRDLDKAQIVSIKWSRHMSFDGVANQAWFKGDVHAETQNSYFDAPELRVDFRDVQPVVASAERISEVEEFDWWIFKPLVQSPPPGDELDRIELAGPSFDKEPIFLYASGGAKAVSRSDHPDGQIKSRILVNGPVLAVDLVQKFMSVEGQGNLLIEDYKRGDRSARVAAAATSDEQVSPFGRLSSDESSQTFISWAGSMVYRYGVNVAQFEKQVQIVHRTGSMIKLAAGIAESDKLRPDDEGGREASLVCNSLVVKFIQGQAEAAPGAGRLSGNEVDAFNANGQVYFEDSGISAIANEITYSRNENVLQILGTDTEHAELFDQRKRFTSLKGPKFFWDRATNQIKAPKSRGNMR